MFANTTDGKFCTLFNGLTGSRQHVGNWPGKTVERKEGEFPRNGRTYQVVDLPGAYGHAANWYDLPLRGNSPSMRSTVLPGQFPTC